VGAADILGRGAHELNISKLRGGGGWGYSYSPHSYPHLSLQGQIVLYFFLKKVPVSIIFFTSCIHAVEKES
jgi:hypothetical protein